MAINIDNEEKGVLVDDTVGITKKFFMRNTHEPIMVDNVIQVEKIEDRSRFRLVEDLSQVGTITDLGTPVTVPGTMDELFDILRVFFLDENAGAGGGGGTPYRVITMPQQVESTYSVSYTGFCENLLGDSSDSIWAVKRMHQDGTETWAGRTTFDQILDNYLSLTYA